MRQKFLECTEAEVHAKIKIIIDNGGTIHHVIVAGKVHMIIYSNGI